MLNGQALDMPDFPRHSESVSPRFVQFYEVTDRILPAVSSSAPGTKSTYLGTEHDCTFLRGTTTAALVSAHSSCWPPTPSRLSTHSPESSAPLLCPSECLPNPWPSPALIP